MTTKQSFKIAADVIYKPNKQHRDKNPNKSQWTISILEEVKVFENTYPNNWIDQSVGWGLHFVNNGVQYLGNASNQNRRLFIAKFMDGNCNGKWHGYPADYQTNIQDIPNEFGLKEWVDKRYLSNAKIAKITQGKPCSL